MPTEDLPEHPVDPTSAPAAPGGDAPAAAPRPPAPPAPAARAARPRWRKWLFYGLASVGALAVGLIVLVVVLVIHDAHSTAPAIDRDAQLESVMTAEYGKYSESDKGWLYVEPSTKTTWLMQVVQRAKVDLPDTTVKGNTALYFVASGAPLASPVTRERILGLFVIQPDAGRTDHALVQISEPYLHLDGQAAIGPQDIRFETLSRDTWGWVVKVARDYPQANRSVVDNRVYAPHDGHIEQLAAFRASGHFDEAAGCVTVAAARLQVARQAEGVAASAAAAASAPAPRASDADEPDEAGDEEGPSANCQDYAYAYRTGALPAEGFVDFLVTGSGLVQGEQRPVKTFKLVFDPKSFAYLVPEELDPL